MTRARFTIWKFSVFAILVLAPTRISAQSDSTPQIVIDGLKILQTRGIQPAAAAWFKGSTLEGDTSAMNTVTGQFDSLPKWLGRPYGYEIAKTYGLGLHIKRTYAVLLLTGGPMYFRFEYYLGPAGWIMQHLDFNTDRDKIFPPSLLLP